ncbi:hypothetical protein Shyd_85620 [Streptomyces hydrogenans]|uniref:Uncharacterized protein n=1 Tax=Streptomyces hydrogenans TaxID=1873719 RepID=A0ABQ3PQ97_9ACTN|nr:hypothetical protein GCM10018784_68950 [Streptomyces hydrogenans]GHI27191.1 hypothetical protein Shyd_85620 [Streptomyces hydrogenans]
MSFFPFSPRAGGGSGPPAGKFRRTVSAGETGRVSTAPPRRPLGPGPDVPDRLPPDRWARTAAGLAAAGEWTAAPDRPMPVPRAGRPVGDSPGDSGTGPTVLVPRR